MHITRYMESKGTDEATLIHDSHTSPNGLAMFSSPTETFCGSAATTKQSTLAHLSDRFAQLL